MLLGASCSAAQISQPPRCGFHGMDHLKGTCGSVPIHLISVKAPAAASGPQSSAGRRLLRTSDRPASQVRHSWHGSPEMHMWLCANPSHLCKGRCSSSRAPSTAGRRLLRTSDRPASQMRLPWHVSPEMHMWLCANPSHLCTGPCSSSRAPSTAGRRLLSASDRPASQVRAVACNEYSETGQLADASDFKGTRC